MKTKVNLFSIILITVSIIVGLKIFLLKGNDHKIHIIVVFKSLSEGKGFWNSVSDGISVAANEFGVDFEITAPLHERDIEG